MPPKSSAVKVTYASKATQTEETVSAEKPIGRGGDELSDLRQAEMQAKVLKIKSEPIEDNFLLDDREKAAIELINCNLARALNISEEEKGHLIDQISALKNKLAESETTNQDIEKQRSIFETSVTLLKVAVSDKGQSERARGNP